MHVVYVGEAELVSQMFCTLHSVNAHGWHCVWVCVYVCDSSLAFAIETNTNTQDSHKRI